MSYNIEVYYLLFSPLKCITNVVRVLETETYKVGLQVNYNRAGSMAGKVAIYRPGIIFS